MNTREWSILPPVVVAEQERTVGFLPEITTGNTTTGLSHYTAPPSSVTSVLLPTTFKFSDTAKSQLLPAVLDHRELF